MDSAQPTLARVLQGLHLSREQAALAMGSLMRGEWTPAQIGAYLAALRMKGEQLEEIAGSAEAMRAAAISVPLDTRPVLDVVGTGGDGAHTINVSSLAALTAAAGGVPVAKHGNRAISGQCGSADVLEYLGFNLEAPPEYALRGVDATGFAFLFAPRFHPAMRHAAAPRRELGVPSIFNLLGPLTNPAGAEWMLLGVHREQDAPRFAQVLALLGCTRALVVHGLDGLDEISLSAPTLVLELSPDGITERRITPADGGLPTRPAAELQLPDKQAACQAARTLVEGQVDSPHADLVALNAAAALQLAGRAESLTQGVEQAKALLREGKVAALLQSAAQYTFRVT